MSLEGSLNQSKMLIVVMMHRGYICVSGRHVERVVLVTVEQL